MHKYYAITGRVTGGDEDVCCIIEAETSTAARSAFISNLAEQEGWSEEELASRTAEGDGIIINSCVVSQTPINFA